MFPVKHYKKWRGVRAHLIPIAKRNPIVELPPSLQFYPSYLTRIV